MNESINQVSEKEIQAIIRELSIVTSREVFGDVVEFGCYLGMASIRISRVLMNRNNREFYVYDSFEGLPEKSSKDSSPLGTHFKAGELLATKKQFIKNINQAKVKMPHIKKAWFNELTDTDVPEKIAFAFLDGDYYESIKVSLKLIEKKLAKGAVIIVHDYNNPVLPGVCRAVDEWLKSHPAKVKYEQTLAVIYI